ncbi:MAG: hypothetical protein ABJB69_01235 [Spartobacteria bacterium]
MLKITPLLAVVTASFICASGLNAAAVDASKAPKFNFKDASGKTQSVDVVTNFQPKKIEHPLAKVDRKLDPKLAKAATIAQERAHAHSRARCWQYVKEALLASGAVNSYPGTANAKEAGGELTSHYGFKKLPVRDPFKAPVGSVLVYGASKAAGHVEIRTQDGFVSDFKSRVPSPRPLLGIYAKS